MSVTLERLTDAQRTTLLLDLVAAGHVRGGNGTPVNEKMMAAREVFITEVADGTGFAAGYADAVAVSVWPSEFGAEGYEIKASRADLKRELSDLSKWQRVGRFCGRWWLVAWDRRWLDDERIPVAWGLLAYDADNGELSTVRRAEKLTPEPWTPAFIAAVIRRSAEAAPCAALMERARSIGYGHGRGAGLSEERAKLDKALAPLLDAYRQSREDGARWVNSVPLEWVVTTCLAAARPEGREP
jgi:hypothetical protein